MWERIQELPIMPKMKRERVSREEWVACMAEELRTQEGAEECVSCGHERGRVSVADRLTGVETTVRRWLLKWMGGWTLQ